MNCNQAQKISIKSVLESFSLFPSKENHKTAFYFALDREEKTPSLAIDFVKNSGFDFGTGKQYDVISIVQILKKCSISDALKYLEQCDFSIQKQTKQIVLEEENVEIIIVKDIQHPALLQYLKSRKVQCQKKWVEEIHYQINGKKYFGVGFKNDSGGYEIRNVYAKINLLKKNITTLRYSSKIVRIFEGFFDFLSYKKIEFISEKVQSDYIILNSVSMIIKLESILQNYEKVELFFDNDNAGDKATETIIEQFPTAKDCREFYRNHKDLNEYLVCKF